MPPDSRLTGGAAHHSGAFVNLPIKETPMRRDTFLKSLAALAAAGALPLSALRRRQRQDDDPRQPGRRLGHHRPRAGQGADRRQARPTP